MANYTPAEALTRIAQLEAALRPFAEMADDPFVKGKSEYTVVGKVSGKTERGSSIKIELMFGALLTAREVIEQARA